MLYSSLGTPADRHAIACDNFAGDRQKVCLQLLCFIIVLYYYVVLLIINNHRDRCSETLYYSTRPILFRGATYAALISFLKKKCKNILIFVRANYFKLI